MRRVLIGIVIVLALLQGCKKDYGISFLMNSVLSESMEYTSSIVLDCEAESTATLTFAMMESWHIEIVGEEEDAGFTVSPMSGIGNCFESVEFTSTAANETEYDNKLGSVNVISSSSNETIYTLSVEQSRQSATAQITLSYFTGTSLSSYFKTNISDAKTAIKSGVLGDKGRYLYLLPTSSTTAELYEVTVENLICYENLVKSYSDFSSLDVGSLSSVIEDVKSHVDFEESSETESQRMNLVISGHGTGWIPYTAGVLSGLSGGYSSEWEPVDPLYPTRYMGVSSDGYMEISELADELAATNIKFGYILFDECFMSSVELLYRIREYTHHVIASPSEIMAAGFPYANVMEYMSTEDGSSFDLQGICEAYYEYYNTESTTPYGCVAVCITSELEALAQAQYNLTLRELTTTEINSLQAYEGRTGDHVFFDLKQYVLTAADESSQELLDAYEAQYDKTFPEEYRLNTDYFYTNIGSSTGRTEISYYSGVTTSAPTQSKYSSSWEEEPWAVATSAVE